MIELNLIGAFCLQIAATALAAWVAGRAWRDRPARMFVVIVAGYSLLNLGSLLKIVSVSRDVAYWSGVVNMAGLGVLEIGLLLMFASIFAPSWFKGRKPIRLILLPFVLFTAVSVADAAFGTRVFVDGITVTAGRVQLARTEVLGFAMFVLFALSWLVPVGILVAAFAQHPRSRGTVAMLVVSIALSAWLGPSVRREGLGPLNQIFALVQMLPVLGALAYMAARTRLLEPTREALDLALESMSEMIAVIDSDGRTIFANRQARAFGVREEQPIDRALGEAGAHSEEVRRLFTGLPATPTTVTVGPQQLELTLSTLRNRRGEIEGGLVLGRDVTEREERNRLLEHLASHDALTGLPNRRQLEGRLHDATARAKASPDAGSVLMFLDLDQFKIINDTLGHAAGDELLTQLSRLLERQIGPDDLLARLGGDEFAVLTGGPMPRAQLLAERCLSAVERFRFTPQAATSNLALGVGGRTADSAGGPAIEQQFRLGLSIGMVAVDGTLEAEALLANADITMYAAKGQGGNRVAVHTPESDHLSRLTSAHGWAARVRDALREDRFELHYQPIVSLHERRVSHHEALVRLRTDDGELVAPGRFIKSAERFGLMPQLDRWVAMRAIRDLRDHADARIFVNVSAASLDDANFVDDLERELRNGHVDPKRIGFEITETAALHDNARAAQALGRLKALGCKLALDDFGVGFTSFAYLRQLPVDVIKIDGSFIKTLDTEPENRAIVLAMHRLARSLGKETVAEWVESERIQEVALELGLTHGQGFWLGKPVASLQEASIPA